MKKQNGMTLVEMMISLSVFTILVAIIFTSLSTFSKIFSSTDATNQLKSYSESAVNKMGLRLSECKRLFENTSQDTPFLSRITGIDSPLPGSRLPKIEETGSLIPGDSLFNASSVGNSLFFTNTEYPEILKNISDGISNTNTVRIDAYIFNYYYLTQTTQYTLGNTPGIRLMEWHSVQYADYTQINAITNATKKSNTIIALRNNNILYAWDPTVTSPSSAFYSLNTGGSMSGVSGHMIQQDTQKEMTKFARGILWGRYRAGISPNTGGSFTTTQTVPKYAAASGYFPAGFEIGIIGPRSAHRVFIRMVLAAEGPSNLKVAYENTVLISARNLW